MTTQVVLALIIHAIVELGLVVTCFNEFRQCKKEPEKLGTIQRTLMAGTIALAISAMELFINTLRS